MAGHILRLQDVGERNDARANDEEGRFEFMFVEVVEEVGGVVRRTIIVGKTPVQSVGAYGYVGIARAAIASPPTPILVSGRFDIGRASSYMGYKGHQWVSTSKFGPRSTYLVELAGCLGWVCPSQ